MVYRQIHVSSCSTYLLNYKNYNQCFLTICFYRLCLVRLIHFCRFADFKLQRNKVQSQNFLIAVTENFDTESIALLLNEKHIEKISLVLQDMYPDKRKPSIRSAKCYCAKHGIAKRILQNTLDNLVAEVIESYVLEAEAIRRIWCNLFPHYYFQIYLFSVSYSRTFSFSFVDKISTSLQLTRLKNSQSRFLNFFHWVINFKNCNMKNGFSIFNFPNKIQK